MSIFQISTNPEYYGSDATDADAMRCAEIIRQHAERQYPTVEFRLDARGASDLDADDDLRSEIQQWINDHWADLV